MKHTKRLLAAVMALTMVSALAPLSAFADTEVKQDSTTQSGTMTATYDVQAKYTVTIPAGVDLKSDASVSKNITASDVMLESGKKIVVKLTDGTNTHEGSTFNAKTEKGDSTATYTIGKGNAVSGVSIGDVVAEFTENGEQVLTFSKAEGATYAGTHTETLTFGISVERVETLLTTLTFGYSGYDQTTSGVVSVQEEGKDAGDPEMGWMWFDNGSLSVTAEEGYTITKCVFRNGKGSITVPTAPFTIYFEEGCVKGCPTLDYIRWVDVYGYAN